MRLVATFFVCGQGSFCDSEIGLAGLVARLDKGIPIRTGILHRQTNAVQCITWKRLAVLVDGNQHRVVSVLGVQELDDELPVVHVERLHGLRLCRRSSNRAAAVVFGEEVDVVGSTPSKHGADGLHLGVLVKHGFGEMVGREPPALADAVPSSTVRLGDVLLLVGQTENHGELMPVGQVAPLDGGVEHGRLALATEQVVLVEPVHAVLRDATLRKPPRPLLAVGQVASTTALGFAAECGRSLGAERNVQPQTVRERLGRVKSESVRVLHVSIIP